MPGNPCPQPSCDENFGVRAEGSHQGQRQPDERRRQQLHGWGGEALVVRVYSLQ